MKKHLRWIIAIIVLAVMLRTGSEHFADGLPLTAI